MTELLYNASGALGINYEICVPKSDQVVKINRFVLQAAARDLLPAERVRFCMRNTSYSNYNGIVKILKNPDRARAYYSGLMVCGSVWNCPVCSARITERRRKELSDGLKAYSGSVFMVTFTIQHNFNDNIKTLVHALKESYRKIKAGRWWQEFSAKYLIDGSVSGTEVTYGLAAGWHPHLHVLFFSGHGKDFLNDHQEEMQAELFGKYNQWLNSFGRFASPLVGVNISAAKNAKTLREDDIAEYIAKYGYSPRGIVWSLPEEITKYPVKKSFKEHYTAWQLLELFRLGDRSSGGLFIEYAEGMKGNKQLVWSKGLKENLGIKIISDLEAAEEKIELNDILLYSLSYHQWLYILSKELRGQVLAVAGSCNLIQFIDYLQSIGLEV